MKPKEVRKFLVTTIRIHYKTFKYAKKLLRDDEVSLSRYIELSLRKYIENKTGKKFKHFIKEQSEIEVKEITE